MITSISRDTQLKSAQGINLPILLAQYWYSQHTNLNFVMDLNHYLHEGQVLSTPGVFAMGKVVLLEGEPVFFVRFAQGKMLELRQHLPTYVKEIAFCRNNRGPIRKYNIDRLEELSTLTMLTPPLFMDDTKLGGNGLHATL
jgi:hypothetical protein